MLGIGNGRAGVGAEIGKETSGSRLGIVSNDGSAGDGGMLEDGRFDFAELDRVATNFDLLIDAAEESMAPSERHWARSPVR